VLAWRLLELPVMWGKRKDKATSKRGHLGAFLDEGSEMEGKYSCAGTVMMDAKFHGEITSKDAIIIGERGVVHATVQTATLVVRGEVVGNVIASERVELKASARVTGDIEAPVIVMEAGAVHDGHCRMAKAGSAGPPLAVVVPMKA
jgi:cytoskeletal protein CcmA (bactofilin family)